VNYLLITVKRNTVKNLERTENVKEGSIGDNRIEREKKEERERMECTLQVSAIKHILPISYLYLFFFYFSSLL